MELVKGRREERLISTMMLRSLKKARYTADCLGHFGLAAKYYCHFTSPIRRYPDLIIHRIIKETLNGKMSEKRIKHYDSILGEIALHSSAMERRADEAEREVDDMKKAEFMSKHIGEEFDGIITSVQGFGFYVELPSTIEGLVHVNSLVDDYYQFDDVNHLLRGERRNLAFRIGDVVKVRVDKADVGSRKIDFSIVEKISSSVENTDMSEGEATNVSDKKIKSRRTAISGKEALRNVRENKYEPEGRSYATRSRSSKVKDKVEKLTGTEPKREYVKSEGAKREEPKREYVKAEGAKREEPKREYVKAEGAKKEGFKKEFVKSDAQKKDSKEINNRRNENMSYTSEKKPYIKDRDDKPKKMSFSEFADTEMKGVKNKSVNYDSKNKDVNYDPKNKTVNYDSKNKADAYDTKKRKSDEPYDGYFEEKGKAPEEYEKRVNRDKTSRSFKYGNDKPELLDEKAANKPTSYYMEKYGGLKPSKPGEKSGKSGGRPGGSSGYKAGGKFGSKPAGNNGGGKIKSSKGK